MARAFLVVFLKLNLDFSSLDLGFFDDFFQRKEAEHSLDCKMDIVDLISQVGFPIVMNLILIIQVNGKLDEILMEIKK